MQYAQSMPCVISSLARLHHAAPPSPVIGSHILQHIRVMHRYLGLGSRGLMLRSCRCLHVTPPVHAEGWAKFTTSVRMFVAGSKALYKDCLLWSRYRKEYGGLVIKKSAPSVIANGKTDLRYPRKELQFTYRVCTLCVFYSIHSFWVQIKNDLKQMWPTVLLFMIPFVGYISPVIA